jgi:hypothetical protein
MMGTASPPIFVVPSLPFRVEDEFWPRQSRVPGPRVRTLTAARRHPLHAVDAARDPNREEPPFRPGGPRPLLSYPSEGLFWQSAVLPFRNAGSYPSEGPGANLRRPTLPERRELPPEGSGPTSAVLPFRNAGSYPSEGPGANRRRPTLPGGQGLGGALRDPESIARLCSTGGEFRRTNPWELGMNLSGSRQQGHSAAHNTLSRLSRLQRIHPRARLKCIPRANGLGPFDLDRHRPPHVVQRPLRALF